MLQSGQPIQLPWIGKVKALVESWYGGDKAGVAAADVLMGKTDPSGRLPMTWPYRLDQEVAHQKSHPGRQSAGVLPSGKLCTAAQSSSRHPVQGHLLRGCGHRLPLLRCHPRDAALPVRLRPLLHELPLPQARCRKDAERGPPGLLHRDQHRQPDRADRPAAVPRRAQVGAPGVQFAPRALAGFARVRLGAHQSKTMTIGVPLRQLQYWSTKSSSWMTAVGPRVLYLASNERTNQLKSLVTVR